MRKKMPNMKQTGGKIFENLLKYFQVIHQSEIVCQNNAMY